MKFILNQRRKTDLETGSFPALRSVFYAILKIFKIFKKYFLTLTLVVRVDFYNGVAIARNRDADFKKIKNIL